MIPARPSGLCGVDEAGRGPLAGPVYAAAVVLGEGRDIAGLDDSKRLSEAVRERLRGEIERRALAWAIASASVAEIDELNILQATLLAMRRAVERLMIIPAAVWVDGNRCPRLAVETRAVVGGDRLVPEISAASILAKTERDRVMRSLHTRYPQYGFDRHKGYPTAGHAAALRAHGACPEHRMSFAPVRTIANGSHEPGGRSCNRASPGEWP